MKRPAIYLIVFGLGILSGALGVYAFDSSGDHPVGHPPDGAQRAHGPSEAGQGGFAAIQEMVRLLESRPDTDWDDVDIASLRKHLVDMHELTLNAAVRREEVRNGIAFHVTGEGRTVVAVRRMVPRHAEMTLSEVDDWRVRTGRIEGGTTLTVRTDDSRQLARARALGFHGLMALGADHPKHHRMIATGRMDY